MMAPFIVSVQVPAGYPQYTVWFPAGFFRRMELEAKLGKIREAEARAVIANARVYRWNRLVRRWATKHATYMDASG